MRAGYLGGALTAFAVAAGCGGGNNRGACGTVAPCGGDVTGTWTLVDSCVGGVVANVQTSLVCTSTLDMTLGSSRLSASESFAGAWVFTKSLTYASNLSVTDTESFQCGDASVACSMRDAAIKAAVAGDPSIIDASCSGPDTNCVCTDTKMSVFSSAGTYSYASNGYQLMFDPNPVFGFSYCVEGDTLHWNDNGAIDPMTPPGSLPDVVFRRE